jgi:opacity protein-like surface antigen
MNTSALHRLILTAALMLCLPLTAAAQPRDGQVALGGDIGLFFPTDEQFDGSLFGGAYVEIYPMARLGVRPSLFVTSPEYERGTDEHERQMRLGVDVIYNWEGGRVHPFAGAGLGAHFLQFTHDGDEIGDSDTELGFTLLGGLEYFLNRAWTIKGEGRYHWVDDERGINPDGLALTVGLKRYF